MEILIISLYLISALFTTVTCVVLDLLIAKYNKSYRFEIESFWLFGVASIIPFGGLFAIGIQITTLIKQIGIEERINKWVKS